MFVNVSGTESKMVEGIYFNIIVITDIVLENKLRLDLTQITDRAICSNKISAQM